jgi:hypothetical protein
VLPLSLVHASYGLVGLYVLADAIHKGRRASHVRAFFLLFSIFFIRHILRATDQLRSSPRTPPILSEKARIGC